MAYKQGRPQFEQRVRRICSDVQNGRAQVDRGVDDVMELLDAVEQNATIASPFTYGVPYAQQQQQQLALAAVAGTNSTWLGACCCPCRTAMRCFGWSVTYCVFFVAAASALALAVHFFYPWLAFCARSTYWFFVWLWQYL